MKYRDKGFMNGNKTIMSNITSHKIAILVTSCDKYRDLWEPFFTLFFRYWSDCPYPIYLGTNHLKYDDDRVTTIVVGDETDWSSDFRCMLEQIPYPYVIVLIEDYLLTQYVDTAKIEKLIEYMEEKRAGCLRLYPCPVPDIPCLDNPEVGEISKGASYRLSLQVAIWNKETLLELLCEGETAWELEINGTKRTRNLDIPFLSVIKNSLISYIGGVNKGKWVKEAVELCKKEGIDVDLNTRPMQTPVDRFIRSSTVGRLIVFARSRSVLADKFINFTKNLLRGII